jgi:hypothetical protein
VQGGTANYSLIYAKELGKIFTVVFVFGLSEFPILLNTSTKKQVSMIYHKRFPAQTLSSVFCLLGKLLLLLVWMHLPL